MANRLVSFLIISLVFFVFLVSFVHAGEASQFSSKSVYSDLTKEEVDNYRKFLKIDGTLRYDVDFFLQSRESAKQTPALIYLYVTYSLEGKDIGTFARMKFSELGLDKKGLPLLNVLVIYSVKDSSINIAYGDSCIYDLNDLSSLARKASAGIVVDLADSESSSISSLTRLVESLDSLALKKYRALRYNRGIYCPVVKTKDYSVNLDVEEESCLPLLDSDKFDKDRLKILILGQDFESEADFKEIAKSMVLEQGFKKISPFKEYTKNGNDGLFYFVYGAHDLNLAYEKSNHKELIYLIKNEAAKCSNVFYTIFLDKTWNVSYVAGFYRVGDDISFNSVGYGSWFGEIVTHETGHHFGLDDEYVYPPRRRPAMKDLYFTCTDNPVREWGGLLSGLGVYSYKGCTFDDNYRSSNHSIMRGWGGHKFNFLSCLYLVREFEREDSIHSKNVLNICKRLYDAGELELQVFGSVEGEVEDETN